MSERTAGVSGEDLVRVTIDFFSHLKSFGDTKGIALQGLVVCSGESQPFYISQSVFDCVREQV